MKQSLDLCNVKALYFPSLAADLSDRVFLVGQAGRLNWKQ